MEPYAYEQLPLQSPAIRLISLFPSSDTDAPLICSISQAELPPKEPYTALSYCWGDATSRHTLTVLGPSSSSARKSLGIAQNLNTALLRIRSPTEPRTLWVDAICINQKDNDEKAKQVPLMAQIYHGATEVLAWLGDAGEDGDAAFSAIKQLSQIWAKAMGAPATTSGPEDDTIMSHSDAFEHSQHLMSLLRRPYFRRVWIIQEIGMGGSRAVVQCGDKTATWEEFVNACTMTIASRAALLYSAGVEFTMMIDMARGKECSKIFERPPELSVQLLSILCRYRNFDATDARDKVFALLNLAEDEELLKDPRLVPNYHKDTATVYRDAAAAIIEVTKSLDILRVPIVKPSSGLGLNLPSWVPDWSAKTQSMTLDIMSFSKSTISEASLVPSDTAKPIISPDGAELTMKAVFCTVKIDRIGRLLSREGISDTEPSILEFDRKTNTEASILLEWEEMAGAHPFSHSSAYPISKAAKKKCGSKDISETVGEAYRQTLLAGREYEVPNEPDACARDFESWNYKLAKMRLLRRLGLLESDKFLRLTAAFRLTKGVCMVLWNYLSPFGSQAGIEYENTARFGDELAASTTGRRFFVTEDGFYGLGPGGLEKEDRVVLVRGCRVPIVIREAPSQTSGGSQKWTLVGDCYVHSKQVLHGEVWNCQMEQDLTLI